MEKKIVIHTLFYVYLGDGSINGMSMFLCQFKHDIPCSRVHLITDLEAAITLKRSNDSNKYM